ncbi:tetratricopeptide repeat protein [bacterium SCSIO 12741]|nr:tetratricopeptide repeat protein [bacterium SCSIO 12741]
MSSDPDNEYFSDGITEEIINALTKIKSLKVIARTSSFAFKNQHMDVREIGKQLGVQSVLEGSVRKAQNQLRITAQLIDVSDGTHIWSQIFDREMTNIFALQDEISLLIADQLRENFGHFDVQDHLVTAPTLSLEAYNFYLKGRYHHLKWNRADLLLGIEYYKESIQLDPTFSLPYFGAGLCSGICASWGFIPYEQGMQDAQEYLEKVMQLDEDSYLGYFALATISLWGNWNFEQAYREVNKSIQLNPAFTDALEALAELHLALGQFEQAQENCQKAIELNPLSANHYYTQGMIHYLMGHFDKAIASMEASLKVDSEFALAIEVIVACNIQLGDYQALNRFLLSRPQVEEPTKCRALFQLIHPNEPVDVNLEEVRDQVNASAASLINWDLYLQVHMGNHELALEILEKAIAVRSGQLINFNNDPFLTPLHKLDKFQQLLTQVYPGSFDWQNEALKPVVEVSTKASVLSKDELEKHLASIQQALVEEKLYLDPSLNLKQLAQEINLHPNKLSWLINEKFGKNFNEYINEYRLHAFKEMALDASNNHLTLLGMAYESGFNSKSVFNSFFKKREGTTPKNWLKEQAD